MRAHRRDSNRIACGIFNHEIPPRFCRYLIRGGLSAFNRHARFQSADDAHRDPISVGSVVTEAIRDPDIRCGFQIRRSWKVNLKARRKHAHNSRTEWVPLVEDFSDYGRIQAELPLKILVADDRHERQPRRRRCCRLRSWWRWRRLRLAVIVYEVASQYNP